MFREKKCRRTRRHESARERPRLASTLRAAVTPIPRRGLQQVRLRSQQSRGSAARRAERRRPSLPFVIAAQQRCAETADNPQTQCQQKSNGAVLLHIAGEAMAHRPQDRQADQQVTPVVYASGIQRISAKIP